MEDIDEKRNKNTNTTRLLTWAGIILGIVLLVILGLAIYFIMGVNKSNTKLKDAEKIIDFREVEQEINKREGISPEDQKAMLAAYREKYGGTKIIELRDKIAKQKTSVTADDIYYSIPKSEFSDTTSYLASQGEDAFEGYTEMWSEVIKDNVFDIKDTNSYIYQTDKTLQSTEQITNYFN